MKKAKKVLALLLAVAIVLGLAACGAKPYTGRDTLVASIEQGLEGKFSPFFSLSAADSDVVGFVSLATFPVDRVGNPVLNGIKGEKRSYNGNTYTYYAAANVDIKQNDDGTVFYDMTMRKDIKYTDGTTANVDDLIFGLYVVLDPTYDGNITMYSLPIQGLADYRTTLFDMYVAAGRDNTDFSKWTEEDQKAFWADLDKAGTAFAQEIIDLCVAAEYVKDPADAAAAWGFSGSNAAEFWADMDAAYEGDYRDLSDTETAGSSLFELMDNYDAYSKTPENSAANISGIQRIDDYTLRIVTTEYDATTIYQLSMYIAPMAYYGDPAQYDYENNKFGFPKGDLSIVREKTTQPVGAGAYIYKSYENGTVRLEANPDYIFGAPKITNLLLLETSEANKTSGVVAGTIDIADPSYSTDTAKEIAKYNGFGEEDWEKFEGPVLTTKLIDYRGYGYTGVNPNLVKVGDNPYSEESKDVRKAIATVLAAYRDEAIDSYYGNTATVINYPISNTSWAAPQTTDDGYQIAYSKDVNGNPIYTADMTADQKYEAAKQAALGFLEAAGYTITDGKVTAAPAGGKTSFQVEIGGGGQGDHPLFLLMKNAADALASIGITFTVNDHADASALYATYQNGTAEFWCAAWQAGTDPDMFQLYHSQGSTNYYHISDATLDELIMQGRQSADTNVRKTTYKAAMEIILDYGVEIPMYQRSDCVLLSSERVNVDSLPKDMTPYWGWAAEIETLEMN